MRILAGPPSSLIMKCAVPRRAHGPAFPLLLSRGRAAPLHRDAPRRHRHHDVAADGRRPRHRAPALQGRCSQAAIEAEASEELEAQRLYADADANARGYAQRQAQQFADEAQSLDDDFNALERLEASGCNDAREGTCETAGSRHAAPVDAPAAAASSSLGPILERLRQLDAALAGWSGDELAAQRQQPPRERQKPRTAKREPSRPSKQQRAGVEPNPWRDWAERTGLGSVLRSIFSGKGTGSAVQSSVLLLERALSLPYEPWDRPT